MDDHKCGTLQLVSIHDEDDDRYKRIIARCDECGEESEFHGCYPVAIGEVVLDARSKFICPPAFFEVSHTPLKPLTLPGVKKLCIQPVVDMTRFSVEDGGIVPCLCEWMAKAREEGY